MISPIESLEKLRRGNARFVANEQKRNIDSAERAALAAGQEPFAVVLGCSDSRVPTEIVFDQGLGDLFVIRVAGNVAAPSLIGSIEFATQKFGSQLVVVLGHTQCGAVDATIEAMQRPGDAASANLAAIVDRVRPAVESLLKSGADLDGDSLAGAAVRRNVSHSVEAICNSSEILSNLIADGKLLVVGAEYSLETGIVDFFDGVPG